YLAWKENERRETTVRGDRLYLNSTWAPLHHRPLASITREDIAALLDPLRSTHKASAHAARQSLHALYRWAILDKAWADTNPVALVRSPLTKADRAKARRTRVLTDADLVDIWNACRDDDFGKIV